MIATADIPTIDYASIQDQAEMVTPPPIISADERENLIRRIKQQLVAQNAVLVAHYYTDVTIQMLAEESGGLVSDSLDMARFGSEQSASTLVVAGVRFMGETAKILNPEKRVLMPSLLAECSLDLSCPASEFVPFCDQHPGHTVVVYANTSARVKARADWVVTSSIAAKVVKHLAERGEKILWGPDKYLGDYIQRETGAEMLLWPGSCIVHERFKGLELEQLRKHHQEAMVLVHPESPPWIIAQAHVVGSTSQLIQAVQEHDAKEYIVATDNGIFYKMQQAAPDKVLLEAPNAGIGATCQSCAHCPWMAMNSLNNLAEALEQGTNEIVIDPEIGVMARRPVQRMLDFAASRP